MCSICGIIDFQHPDAAHKSFIQQMGKTLKHRGPDTQAVYLAPGVALQHNRLAIMDVANGLQPMTRHYQGKSYTIIYNGEIYNLPELTQHLKKEGIVLETHCDTEVVLWMYILHGKACSSWLNGIFAFAIWDEAKQYLYLSRDRLGVKPFFYTQKGSTFLFASEVKGLLAYPGIKAQLDQEGLWQLIFLAPNKLEGSSIFHNIHEIPPAYHGIYDQKGLHLTPYWQLEAKPFEDSYEEAIAHTRHLVTDAIEKQLVSDVPLATLLSGGLDSSVITSVAARKYQACEQVLSTYSFEYENNRDYFKSSLFQPQSDDDFAPILAQILGTNHHILTVPIQTLIDLLENAAIYRDLPGMADIDSSLMYYCQQIKQNHTVVLSGECADEIFGGYPWFYRPEMWQHHFFPWIHDPYQRAHLFLKDATRWEEGYNWLQGVYKDQLAACPVLESDTPTMRQSRQATWLCIHYFMTALLERKDRMSMASGVEVRVPFADHRILEYVYNLPWELKYQGGVEKALLRQAMKDYLPEAFLKRKKSPYPKTHHPAYETQVYERLMKLIQTPECRLRAMIDTKQLENYLTSTKVTWFGQLMSRPQLISWLLQLETWLTHYDVNILK